MLYESASLYSTVSLKRLSSNAPPVTKKSIQTAYDMRVKRFLNIITTNESKTQQGNSTNTKLHLRSPIMICIIAPKSVTDMNICKKNCVFIKSCLFPCAFLISIQRMVL